VEILKQPQYSPSPVEEQVAVIYLGTNGLLNDVPVNKVKEFEEVFLNNMRSTGAEALADLKKGKLTDTAIATVKKIGAEVAAQFKR